MEIEEHSPETISCGVPAHIRSAFNPVFPFSAVT